MKTSVTWPTETLLELADDATIVVARAATALMDVNCIMKALLILYTVGVMGEDWDAVGGCV